MTQILSSYNNLCVTLLAWRRCSFDCMVKHLPNKSRFTSLDAFNHCTTLLLLNNTFQDQFAAWVHPVSRALDYKENPSSQIWQFFFFIICFTWTCVTDAYLYTWAFASAYYIFRTAVLYCKLLYSVKLFNYNYNLITAHTYRTRNVKRFIIFTRWPFFWTFEDILTLFNIEN